MSDEKPKPVDDFKHGLELLFRAAKGVVEKLPTGAIEDAVKDGAKEVGRAFETVASELDKAFASVSRGTASAPSPPESPPGASAPTPAEEPTSQGAAPKATAPPFGDADALAPPKGPRIG